MTLRIEPELGGSRFFPPLDRAVVQALACEAVAKTGLPNSRQSLADLMQLGPAFAAKASPILDRYQGFSEGRFFGFSGFRAVKRRENQ